MKKQHTPDKGVDLSAECDFHEIPQDELRACAHYEYARESKRVIEVVKDIQADMKKQVFPKKACQRLWGESLNRSFLFYELLVTSTCADFPTRPWQRLAAQEKALLNPDGHGLIAQVPPLVLDVRKTGHEITLQEWMDAPHIWKHMGQDLDRVGFFYISLFCDEDTLVSEFRTWLRSQKPQPPQIKRKRGRHGGSGSFYRDALNQLGAMRLRYYCTTLSEAERFMLPLKKLKEGSTEKNRFLTYSGRTRFNRACNDAVSRFKTFFALPDDELPIHHTAGVSGDLKIG